MKIISHRGGAKLAPENSIEAIKLSKALRVDATEIDIHISKDNKLVVYHDYDLKRLAGINKPITSLSLNEIKKIELKSGAMIPTLSEVIKASGDMPLVIEGKGGAWAKLLSKELLKHRFTTKPQVISFNENELKKFHELSPEIDCFVAEIFRGLKAIKLAKKYGFKGIGIHFLGMNPFVYKKAKSSGIKIVVYTMNSEKLAKYYAKLYPDIELGTDRPDKMLKLVKNN